MLESLFYVSLYVHCSNDMHPSEYHGEKLSWFMDEVLNYVKIMLTIDKTCKNYITPYIKMDLYGLGKSEKYVISQSF